MYIKKTVFTKNRIFVEKIKCYYFDPEAAKKERGPRRYQTGESKQERNRRRAYNQRKYLLYNNFETGDIWITLTYAAESIPENGEAAHKELMRVLSLIRKKLYPTPFVWFAKTEAGERMRVHHHLLIKKTAAGMIDLLYSFWKKNGQIKDFREIYNLNNGKLITYFLDGGDHKQLNFEKYSHSRNMAKPKIKTQIMPMKSFRMIPLPPKANDGAEYMIQNLYNGYTDRDGYIYQSYELVRRE